MMKGRSVDDNNEGNNHVLCVFCLDIHHLEAWRIPTQIPIWNKMVNTSPPLCSRMNCMNDAVDLDPLRNRY
jgi:hypothetical protein